LIKFCLSLFRDEGDAARKRRRGRGPGGMGGKRSQQISGTQTRSARHNVGFRGRRARRSKLGAHRK
jgi:hypothetical protein